MRRNAAASTTVKKVSRVSLKSGRLDPRVGRAWVFIDLSVLCTVSVDGFRRVSVLPVRQKEWLGAAKIVADYLRPASQRGRLKPRAEANFGCFCIFCASCCKSRRPCSRFFFIVLLNFWRSRRSCSPLLARERFNAGGAGTVQATFQHKVLLTAYPTRPSSPETEDARVRSGRDR